VTDAFGSTDGYGSVRWGSFSSSVEVLFAFCVDLKKEEECFSLYGQQVSGLLLWNSNNKVNRLLVLMVLMIGFGLGLVPSLPFCERALEISMATSGPAEGELSIGEAQTLEEFSEHVRRVRVDSRTNHNFTEEAKHRMEDGQIQFSGGRKKIQNVMSKTEE